MKKERKEAIRLEEEDVRETNFCDAMACELFSAGSTEKYARVEVIMENGAVGMMWIVGNGAKNQANGCVHVDVFRREWPGNPFSDFLTHDYPAGVVDQYEACKYHTKLAVENWEVQWKKDGAGYIVHAVRSDYADKLRRRADSSGLSVQEMYHTLWNGDFEFVNREMGPLTEKGLPKRRGVSVQNIPFLIEGFFDPWQLGE